MNAIIRIHQDDALKAGLNIYGEQSVNFDPKDLTQEQRDKLADYNNYGNGYKVPTNGIHPVAEANLETLRFVLDEQIRIAKEKKAKEEAEAAEARLRREAAIEKFLETPDEELLLCNPRSDSVGIIGTEAFIAFGKPKNPEDKRVDEAIKKIDSLKQLGKKKNAEWQDAERNEIKEKERIAKEKEQRRRDQIKEWVMKHGTVNQRARFHEGFLPEKEVIDAIRNEVFRAFDDFDRYERMNDSDVCECEYGICNVSFSVEEMPKMTAEEFEFLEKLRETNKDAEIIPRLHIGEADYCDGKEYRMGFKVNISVGELNLSREYEM